MLRIINRPDESGLTRSAKVPSTTYHLEYFGDSEFDTIKSWLSKDDKKLINPDEVYEVELKGRKYYPG
jgi:hypothetical protein